MDKILFPLTAWGPEAENAPEALPIITVYRQPPFAQWGAEIPWATQDGHGGVIMISDEPSCEAAVDQLLATMARWAIPQSTLPLVPARYGVRGTQLPEADTEALRDLAKRRHWTWMGVE